jgi:hypothetical protein
MTPIEMLDELRKSWRVGVFKHPDNGDAVVELYAPDDCLDLQARYVEPQLTRAIARAWAGEPSDG